MFLNFAKAVILSVSGDCNSARIEVIVPNVSQLGRFEGNKVSVGGVNWRLIIQRRGDVLDVLLKGDEEIIPGEPRTIGQNDAYNVDISFELLSYLPTQNSFKQSFDPIEYPTPYFYWGIGSIKGCYRFLTWEQFTDTNKGYVISDKAIFVVEFTVGERMFMPNRQ